MTEPRRRSSRAGPVGVAAFVGASAGALAVVLVWLLWGQSTGGSANAAASPAGTPATLTATMSPATVMVTATTRDLKLARAKAAGAPARFVFSVAPVSASLRERMVSWHPGCPVGLDELRVVHVSYFGFDGKVHPGVLMVRNTAVRPIVTVLRRLFALRFPIRRMQLVDDYGADDFRSIEADNTSAFNCRLATGSTQWSEHAYGEAIDLDPIENPYVTTAGTTAHAASRRYLDRSLQLPGMVHAGDAVVQAFTSVGWGWGGTWTGARDYQHFSANGR